MDTEQEILKLLAKENLYGEQVAKRLKINSVTANKYLIVLEARGFIKCLYIGRAKVWSLVK